MNKTIQVIIEPVGDIQIGTQLEVIGIDGNRVKLQVKTESTPGKKRKISEILASYNGGLFKSASEVDEYLREERESWDK